MAYPSPTSEYPFPTSDVGNTTGTAGTINLDMSVYGRLEVAGDQDWYAVELQAGVDYEFRLQGVGFTPLADPILELRNSTGTIVATDDDGNGAFTYNPIIESYTPATSGTYYLNARDIGNNDPGDFLLTATVNNPNGYVLTADEVAWQLTNNFERWFDFADQSPNVSAPAWDVSDNSRIITYNDDGLTAEGRTMARMAMEMWEDVSGIDYTYVATGQEITLDDNAGGVNAFATSNDTAANREITSATVQVTTGWLTQFGTGFDSYSYETWVHEFGHTLGFGHSGNYNGSAVYGTDNFYLNDSMPMSVLSYMQNRNDEFSGGSFGYNDYVDAEFRWLLTPMIADIIAVQNIYGLATDTRLGNTTYGYNSNTGNAALDALTTLNDPANENYVGFTIFDNGGTDRVDLSQFGGDQQIDLREGAMSSVLGGTLNMGIAYGTGVEEALGGTGTDRIDGNDLNNYLWTGNDSGVGLDIIRGYGGNDTISAMNTGPGSEGSILLGGTGNDTYLIDNNYDAIIEFSGEGTDTVMSDISYTLRNFLDRLELTGNGASGYGNENNNTIIGNSLNNTLQGRAGDDALYGLGGNDTLIGGRGADYLSGGTGIDTAYYVDSSSGLNVSLGNSSINTGIARGDTYNSIENLTGSNYDDVLNGRAGGSDNVIRGGGGNDTLKGYSGNDDLLGGSGNDILIGGQDGDLLAGGSGTDMASYSGANSGVTASLANSTINTGDAMGDTYNSVEGLIGSSYGDNLNANGGNNTVMGMAGNDFLKGYTGNDILTGGTGIDRFIFNTTLNAATNVDTITDMAAGVDEIRLEDSIFSAIPQGAGTMLSGYFKANAAGVATDANDRIIYETDNGRLWYDADGTGAASRVLFADLQGGLSLSASDFFIY